MEQQSEEYDGLIFNLKKKFGKPLARQLGGFTQIADAVGRRERVLIDGVKMIPVVAQQAFDAGLLGKNR